MYQETGCFPLDCILAEALFISQTVWPTTLKFRMMHYDTKGHLQTNFKIHFFQRLFYVDAEIC